MEQFVWLIKSGLIETRHARQLQKISAKDELFGCIGSISLKLRDLNRINRELFFLQITFFADHHRDFDCQRDRVRGGSEADSETEGEEVDELGFDRSEFGGRVGGAGEYSGRKGAAKGTDSAGIGWVFLRRHGRS